MCGSSSFLNLFFGKRSNRLAFLMRILPFSLLAYPQLIHTHRRDEKCQATCWPLMFSAHRGLLLAGSGVAGESTDVPGERGTLRALLLPHQPHPSMRAHVPWRMRIFQGQ